MRTTPFNCGELDLWKSLTKIQKGCSQISRRKGCTKADGQPTSFTSARRPHNSGERVKLLKHRAGYSEKLAASRCRPYSTARPFKDRYTESVFEKLN